MNHTPSRKAALPHSKASISGPRNHLSFYWGKLSGVGRQNQKQMFTSLPLLEKTRAESLGLWSQTRVVTYLCHAVVGKRESSPIVCVCAGACGCSVVWSSLYPVFHVLFLSPSWLSFYRPDHLNGHIKQVHTSERPHKCQVGAGPGQKWAEGECCCSHSLGHEQAAVCAGAAD